MVRFLRYFANCDVQNQLKGLSVSGGTRLAALPALPTWKELSLPASENGTWQGFLATGGTPAKTVERLNADRIATGHTRDDRPRRSSCASFEARARRGWPASARGGDR